MVGLMAGGLMAAMPPGVVTADPPAGACPSSYDLLFPPIGDDAKFDRNGDGLICVKRIGRVVADDDPQAWPGNSSTWITGPGGKYGAVVKDDNQPS